MTKCIYFWKGRRPFIGNISAIKIHRCNADCLHLVKKIRTFHRPQAGEYEGKKSGVKQ